MSWLVYVLFLPFAVYLYACALGVIDARAKVVPLVRLVAVSCAVLLVVTLTNPDFISPVLLSLLTVVIIHWASFIGVRRWGLGMPIYANRPKAEQFSAEDAPEADADMGTFEGSPELDAHAAVSAPADNSDREK